MEKFGSGSGINIPGPQHWIDVPAFFQKLEDLQPDVKDDTKEEDGDERKNGAGRGETILRLPFLSRKVYTKNVFIQLRKSWIFTYVPVVKKAATFCYVKKVLCENLTISPALSSKNNTGKERCVGDPDPHVFGPFGSGSISQRYGSGFGSGSGLRLKIMCLRVSYKKKNKEKINVLHP